MNLRSLTLLAGFALLPAASAQAEPAAVPVKLRYHFEPGQKLRYLVQRDPYFADPAGAMETTDPNAPYRPPVVERLTEEVLAVGRDGTATIRVMVAPEPGFENEARPQPPVTRTVTVTPLGQVLSPVTDPAMREMLWAFFRLPAVPVRAGASWKGTELRGMDKVGTSVTLTTARGGRRGLAVITQTLPPVVTQGRSPDHDGTLLQTTRSAQADRIVFDLGAGNLLRQSSALTVTLSLTMTGRGARGAADFGHVIPNVQVVQTMTIERQGDPLPPLPPAPQKGP